MTATTIEYGHATRVPVHFDDLDALGVMHNARYAVLVERVMIQWWAEQGVSFAGGRPTTPDAFNVIREYAITFHRPIRGTGEMAFPAAVVVGGRLLTRPAFRLIAETRLREIFTAAGGTHEDWDEYDRVMLAERRTAVLVTPTRVYGS